MTSPPQAPQHPHEHTQHGVRRADPYFWMRDLTSRDLLAHLDAERVWYESATGHLSSLVESLLSEMTSRVPPTELSVSWRYQGLSYYTALPAGRDYPQLLRDFNSQIDSGLRNSRNRGSETLKTRSQLLLDQNELLGGSGYLDLGLTLVSPDSRLLAYSVDQDGDEVYELRFRDIDSGRDLDDVVPRSYYGGAWSADSRVFLYTVHDEAYRPFQVWRHTIGTSTEDDVLVLEEHDQRFELNLRATRSGGLILIWAGCRDTTEAWALDPHHPEGAPRSVGGRRRGVEYHPEHVVRAEGGEELLLVTNDGATEFRLARCRVPRDGDQDHTSWEPGREEAPGERLLRVDAFAGHVVVGFRSGGRHRLRVLPLELPLSSDGIVVDPLADGWSVQLGRNQEFDAASVTVVDQSYVHPPVWSDVDMSSGVRDERHRLLAPGHDPASYVCEMRTVPSSDGTPVGVTLVRHRDTPLDGTAPALLYGYGAYEAVDEPEWDAVLPSLLDRGVVFAHTHIRGGGENGRRWWLDGHLEHKQQSFDDHIAVADGIDGLVDGARLATRGLSAGGLLQGAVFSQRPDRWRAVVAEVPFVDVVTTMFDADIPLTANEWDEWGDPRNPEEFAWLLAYSPYDNLPPAGSRPDLLVTGALHDPRVMVFEPAKWVAALRESDPGWSPRCLFRAETGAGAHVGPSGRFGRLRYEAEIYAWLLDKLLTDESVATTVVE